MSNSYVCDLRLVTRLLHGHGLVTRVTSPCADHVRLVLDHGDAAAVAAVTRPRTVRLAGAHRRVLALGAGHETSLGPQPSLVAAVVDDVQRSGQFRRVAAVGAVATAFGVPERAVYELLAGRRALHWDELGGVATLDPVLRGTTLDRLRRLGARGIAPVPVRSVEPVPSRGDGYSVAVSDGVCGLLADDLAVGTRGDLDNRLAPAS